MRWKSGSFTPDVKKLHEVLEIYMECKKVTSSASFFYVRLI